MFFIAVTNIAVCILGVVLVWSWVAFIWEAIARRTGKTSAVPYPDDVVWARFGKSLLDLGLFGGALNLPHRPQGSQLPRRREVAGRGSRISPAGRHAALHNAGASEAGYQGRE
jgi:hypothetical protein